MAHQHGAGSDADGRYLAIALGLIVAFMAVEVVVALASRSLALLADSGHMLTDVGAIAGSLLAARVAGRPATATMTYGYKRAEILAATGNGLTLLLVSVLVLYEAIRRLVHPDAVHGLPLLVVAAVGVAVNLGATTVLSRADRSSLNVEGAFQHVMTDLYAFVATVIAGTIILVTGFRRADPLASLVVVGLMLRASLQLLRPGLRILVEATPDNMDLAEVRSHILELDEVIAVHDVHAWTLSSGLPMLTAHVVVSDECLSTGEAGRVLDHLQACLAGHFDVEHSTFQLELVGHADHEHDTHD